MPPTHRSTKVQVFPLFFVRLGHFGASRSLLSRKSGSPHRLDPWYANTSYITTLASTPFKLALFVTVRCLASRAWTRWHGQCYRRYAASSQAPNNTQPLTIGSCRFLHFPFALQIMCPRTSAAWLAGVSGV